MNKENLADMVVSKLECSKKAGRELIEELFESIGDNLARGQEVSVSGFGSFKIAARAARQGINPRTGAKIQIPARKAVKFRAAKQLKEKVA